MRLGRRKRDEPGGAVALPEVSTDAMLVTPDGGRIRARVLESCPDLLSVAIMVPIRPLTPSQLETLVLEFAGPRGRVRLQGTFESVERDVLHMHSPRSVEVLQQRDYVRIEAARPVVVYAGAAGGQVQSFTVDISGGGLLLAGPDNLAVGDLVSFSLSIETGQPPIAGKGRIVRVDVRGRRAIRFEEISDLDRRRLVRFIFECQRLERRRGLEGGGGAGR